VIVGDPILPAMYFRSSGGVLGSGSALTGKLGPFGEFAVTSLCGPREIVNLRTGQSWPIDSAAPDSMYCARFAFSHTGEETAVVYDDLLRVWATHTGDLLLEMELPSLRSSEYYDSLAFRLDDEQVAFARRNSSTGKTFRVDLNSHSLHEIAVPASSEWFQKAVGVMGDTFLYAYRTDFAYRVDIRDVISGARVARFSGPRVGSPRPYDLLVVPSGPRVLLAGEKADAAPVRSFVQIWDLDHGLLLWQGESDGTYLPGSLVVSRDGRYAAIVHKSGEVAVWELPAVP